MICCISKILYLIYIFGYLIFIFLLGVLRHEILIVLVVESFLYFSDEQNMLCGYIFKLNFVQNNCSCFWNFTNNTLLPSARHYKHLSEFSYIKLDISLIYNFGNNSSLFLIIKNNISIFHTIFLDFVVPLYIKELVEIKLLIWISCTWPRQCGKGVNKVLIILDYRHKGFVYRIWICETTHYNPEISF